MSYPAINECLKVKKKTLFKNGLSNEEEVKHAGSTQCNQAEHRNVTEMA